MRGDSKEINHLLYRSCFSYQVWELTQGGNDYHTLLLLCEYSDCRWSNPLLNSYYSTSYIPIAFYPYSSNKIYEHLLLLILSWHCPFYGS
jgi:hypothetical protein